MAETQLRLPAGAARAGIVLGRIAAWGLVALLALVVAAELIFFGIHAAHLLSYPYPLDYGEGPLLAQVQQLLAGTPIWRLYANPGAPPYAVVNYPPLYHIVTAALAWPLSGMWSHRSAAILAAGRIVSLLATAAAALALWQLSRPRAAGPRWRMAARLLVVMAFLGLPIVREWGALMRVDMLGLALGLWGLAIVRRHAGSRRVLWAALPLLLSLFVKPSLLAAPAAALLWLLFRDWRRALGLGALIGLSGGVLFGLLQLGSGGWFATHMLGANANDWQLELARGFWKDQMRILWPLLAAAALGALAGWLSPAARAEALLPLYYCLFGAIVAFGIGKVGAYANYFLEFYAGLIWLSAWATHAGAAPAGERPARWPLPQPAWLAALAPLLLIGALLRYYPLWSETYLKPYGMIEKANPPRIAFGGYGVLSDLRREDAVLAAFARINSALTHEVSASDAPIFTDVPGVAAQAGQIARLQAFEHRQLLDAGLWDQRPLLRDMANGQVPLVVLDYLGNWLSDQMITLITHRYAQDGSRGTFDTYRPVALGLRNYVNINYGNSLHMSSYYLGPAISGSYQPGEIIRLTLELQNQSAATADSNADSNYEVVTWLKDAQGQVLFERAEPLLYGALPPSDWGAQPVQHMQTITLPPDLPDGHYMIDMTLRANGADLAPAQALATLTAAEQGGRQLGEQGYMVPAPLIDAWRSAGGYDGPGDPQMPAMPFDGFTLQCFARACAKLTSGNTVSWLPLGELVYLADGGAGAELPAAPGAPRQEFADTGKSLSGAFLSYWNEHGGQDKLGPPISGQLQRGDLIIQYTRYARLERPAEGGEVRLGQVGADFLRLPGGGPYRWP